MEPSNGFAISDRGRRPEPRAAPVSKREAQLQTEIRSRDMVMFTTDDVRHFLAVSRTNAHRIITNMLRKRLAVRVQRDLFVLRETWDTLDSYELATNIVDAAYLAFWSALHFHSMTDQVPRTILLATCIRKQPLDLRGETVRFVTVQPEFFFGYERHGRVTVSTPEKTIIDCLRLPHYAGGILHIARTINEGLDVSAMVECALQHGLVAINARLGYLLERKGFLGADRRLEASIRAYSVLEPGTHHEPFELNERWKLYVNIDVGSENGWSA